MGRPPAGFKQHETTALDRAQNDLARLKRDLGATFYQHPQALAGAIRFLLKGDNRPLAESLDGMIAQLRTLLRLAEEAKAALAALPDFTAVPEETAEI